jgi:hypothetical protein
MTSLPRIAALLRQGATPLVCLLWLGAAGFGFHVAVQYQGTAGEPAEHAGVWPDGVALELDPLRPTLVVAVHPHCPCTRATLRELERIAARCRDAARIRALFYADPALGADWEQSDLWRQAGAIPGVEVVSDPLGATAARFGARTSGQVLLFDRSGKLVFEGGITAARGHEGANAGAQAVIDLLLGERALVESTPVFGCGLHSEGGARQ